MGGSKSFPAEMQKHLAHELEVLIRAKFTDADGTQWSQKRIGDQLGCSQPQISDVLQGKKVGPGILLAMSRETGKTIDELLGPTAPGYRRAHKNGVIIGKTLELLNRLDAAGYGYSGKNIAIPRLMRELRVLLEAPDDPEYREELQSVVPPKSTDLGEDPPRIAKRQKTG